MMCTARLIPTYMSRQEFDHAVYISLQHRYVFFSVSKVASTYVKECLHLLEAWKANTPHELDMREAVFRYAMPHETHNRAGSPLLMPSLLPDGILYEALYGESFFRFAFMRDPIDRALSAYYDKIWHPTDVREYQRGLAMMEDDRAPGSIDEELFIKLLNQVPRPLLDSHLRPQTELTLQKSGVRLDFVGGLRDVSASLEKVFARVKPGFIKPPMENWMMEHNTRSKPYRRPFRRDTMDHLRNFYVEDIKFYNETEIDGGK